MEKAQIRYEFEQFHDSVLTFSATEAIQYLGGGGTQNTSSSPTEVIETLARLTVA